MIRTLAIAAGLAVGVTSAQAGFTGILIEEGDSAAAAVVAGQAVTLLRVYAMYDGPGDFNVPPTPNGDANVTLNSFSANITPTTSFFIQDTTAILGANQIVPVGSFNQFGTWGTLGSDNSFLNPVAVDPFSAITPSLLTGGFRNDNPPNNQGAAGNGPQPASGGFGTLLYQLVLTGVQGDGSISSFSGVGTPIFLDQFGNKRTLTTVNGLGFLEGVFEFGIRDPDSPIVNEIHFANAVIPTPGSLALFGLAGLAAARRRR